MQPSRLRLVARQLALYLLPPYRSMVAHFAQLTEKIDRIEQSQIASSAAQDRTLAVLQQLSDTLAFAKQQGSSESSRNDSEFQKPTAVNKSARSRIQIVITRVDTEWVITPDLFEVFSFQDGDQLSVVPAEKARQL